MSNFASLCIAVLVVLGIPVHSNAQQYLLAAGNQAEGSGGSVSWSVGMMTFSSCTGSGGDLFEGIQHPYELFFMTGIAENQERAEVLVYPNPAGEVVTVKFTCPQPLIRNIRVYDFSGALVRRVDGVTGTVLLSLDNLAPGPYFLVIYEQDTPRGNCRFIRR